MSSKMNANVASLMAFLLWNALTHYVSRAKQALSVLSFRWLSTREGYEVSLGNLPGTRFRSALTNDLGGLATSIFEVVIVIFIIGALIGNIANVTTGITIAHTGFTPNANLTSSPGAVPLTQLYPLVFVAIGLMAAFAYFKHVET